MSHIKNFDTALNPEHKEKFVLRNFDLFYMAQEQKGPIDRTFAQFMQPDLFRTGVISINLPSLVGWASASTSAAWLGLVEVEDEVESNL